MIPEKGQTKRWEGKDQYVIFFVSKHANDMWDLRVKNQGMTLSNKT